MVIFERLGFMRDSFAVLSHSLGEGFLFVHLPPLRRVTAVEPRTRGQRRVKRSRRRPGVQRPVQAALKDRQLQFLGNLRMAVCVIISLVFWFWMWGIPGGILSMPMLAITKIICDRLQPLAAFGHFLEG